MPRLTRMRRILHSRRMIYSRKELSRMPRALTRNPERTAATSLPHPCMALRYQPPLARASMNLPDCNPFAYLLSLQAKICPSRLSKLSRPRCCTAVPASCRIHRILQRTSTRTAATNPLSVCFELGHLNQQHPLIRRVPNSPPAPLAVFLSN